jgi:hypothetical protein
MMPREEEDNKGLYDAIILSNGILFWLFGDTWPALILST